MGKKRQPPTGLHAFAAELLEIGKPRDQVMARLVEHGATPQEAADIVHGLADSQVPDHRSDAPAMAQVGPKNMLVGTLVFAVGLGATYMGTGDVSFGPEVMLIAYGAMFIGAAQFAYGLLRQVNG